MLKIPSAAAEIWNILFFLIIKYKTFSAGAVLWEKRMRVIHELPQFDLSHTQKKVEIVVLFFTIFWFWC